MNYIVLHYEDMDFLVEQVNKKIDEWYLPYWALMIGTTTLHWAIEYIQVMTKKEVQWVTVEQNIKPITIVWWAWPKIQSNVTGSMYVTGCLDCGD